MPYLRPTVNQLSPLGAPHEPGTLAESPSRERTDDAAQRSRPAAGRRIGQVAAALRRTAAVSRT
jgi:hypothetical protein